MSGVVDADVESNVPARCWVDAGPMGAFNVALFANKDQSLSLGEWFLSTKTRYGAIHTRNRLPKELRDGIEFAQIQNDVLEAIAAELVKGSEVEPPVAPGGDA